MPEASLEKHTFGVLLCYFY